MKNQMIGGWAIYSSGTANESPHDIIIINPINPRRPIDFHELSGCRRFTHLSFCVVKAGSNLVGCSALLVMDWNNGIERLWIIGHDNELKFTDRLDTGYDLCSDGYIVSDGCVYVNSEKVWPLEK